MGKKRDAVLSDYKRQLVKEIQALAQYQDWYTVFNTFLEISATSLGMEMDPHNGMDWKKQYTEITKNMKPEELTAYARMLAQLCLAVRNQKNDPRDILGEIYEEKKMNDRKKGQVFTPMQLSRLLAQLAFPKETILKRKPPVLINEPSCGSGALIIAAASVFQMYGYDYKNKVFFIAQDVDIRCVWMTYIQLCLYEIPAVVIHGNTLARKEWSSWYTPCSVLPFLNKSKEDA